MRPRLVLAGLLWGAPGLAALVLAVLLLVVSGLVTPVPAALVPVLKLEVLTVLALLLAPALVALVVVVLVSAGRLVLIKCVSAPLQSLAWQQARATNWLRPSLDDGPNGWDRRRAGGVGGSAGGSIRERPSSLCYTIALGHEHIVYCIVLGHVWKTTFLSSLGQVGEVRRPPDPDPRSEQVLPQKPDKGRTEGRGSYLVVLSCCPSREESEKTPLLSMFVNALL